MGDTVLGQWAVMGKFPGGLWRRSPWKSLEPPIWKEVLRKHELIQSFLVLGTWVLLDECTEIHQALAACSGQYSLHRSTEGKQD